MRRGFILSPRRFGNHLKLPVGNMSELHPAMPTTMCFRYIAECVLTFEALRLNLKMHFTIFHHSLILAFVRKIVGM
jgi:hypothetical protein